MAESLPAEIAGYRVLGLLGRGGMGVVYRCADEDGQEVAIKLLREELDGLDEGMVRRFEREARIRIDHPNVVRVLDAGEYQGRPFIVFEVLEGVSLAGLLGDRKRLDPKPLVDILRQVALGLTAAHAAGVVHRDLKPGNIFCGSDGTVKLLDFGVARLKERSKLTATGAILGTPAYLSPEQINGRRDVDGRSDLWALGVIAYEGLAGVLPFRQDAPYAVLMSILVEDPIPLRRAAPETPPDLAAIVERLLSKDPDDRFSSSAEVADALAELPMDRWAAVSRTELPPSSASVELSSVEQRVIALVLAREVSDPNRAYQAISERAGLAVPMRENVVGLFGSRTWHGDEVRRAVEAALACRPFAEQVGVGVGRALGGDAGEGVSGEAVEAAFHASELPLAGVGLARSSAPAVHGSHRVRDVDGHLELVEVLAAAEGGLTGANIPMFGRDEQLAALEALWAKVSESGEPGLAVVRGPLGVGKSRLLRAFQARLREQGVEPLGGRGDPAHHLRFLWLLGEVIRRDIALHAPDRTLEQALSARVREVLPDEGAGLGSAAVLGELLGVTSAETVSIKQAGTDPQLMGDMVRLTVEDYLAAVLEAEPGALVLEDAQFADDATLELVEGLPDRLAGPALVVLALRSDSAIDPRERFEFWPHMEVIDLEPLPPAAALRFARAIGGEGLNEDTADAVIRRAEGNPLYVEHMVLSLLQSSPDPRRELPLPVTVEAAIQSRIQLLGQAEREVLKRASIFAQTFDGPLLEALGVEQPQMAIDQLIDRAVLETRGEPTATERRLAFRADLVREVAGRMLTSTARRGLHAAAAAYLAAVPNPDPEEVADHHERAAEEKAAAKWYARAAIEASGRGDVPSVLRCTGRAQELGPPEHLRFDMHFLRADALRFLHRRSEQGDELEKAMEVAATPVQRVRAMVELASFLLRTGKAREALARAGSAVRESRRLDAPAVKALAHAGHGEALLYADRTDQAETAFDRADQALEGLDAPRDRALIEGYRAQLATVRGDFGAALAHRRRAIELSERAKDFRRQAAQQVNAADLLNRYGLYREAAEGLRRAVESCRRVGNRIAEPYARANLGYSLTRLGEFEEAFRELDEAALGAEQGQDDRLGAFVALYRVQARLASGDSATALAEAEALATSADAQRMPQLATLARAVAGRAALALGDHERALGLSSVAYERLERLGGIEEDRASVYLAHAAALEAAGRDDDAVAVRARGRAWLDEAAARITDLDLRRSFCEAVFDNRALAEA